MDEIIRVKNLTKVYEDKFVKNNQLIAVDNVSFHVNQGETVGLLGESGSGKSTIGKLLLGLEKPTDGEIYFFDKPIHSLSKSEFRPLRRDIQMIFQNPFGALDRKMSIRDSLLEPLNLWRIGSSSEERMEKIHNILEVCGLDKTVLSRKPLEFSGGQLQRITIARALLSEPKFLVADEIVSSLDVNIQNQILKLLLDIIKEYKLSILFVTHDIAVARKISDRIIVMKDGKIEKDATTKEVLETGDNDYINQLKAAIF